MIKCLLSIYRVASCGQQTHFIILCTHGTDSVQEKLAHADPTSLPEKTSGEPRRSSSSYTQPLGTSCTCRRIQSAMARNKMPVSCPAHHHESTPSCSSPIFCRFPPSPLLLAPTPCPTKETPVSPQRLLNLNTKNLLTTNIDSLAVSQETVT
jgi:hypothetical protein